MESAMSHQAKVRSKLPRGPYNTSLLVHEALPWGKVLPGHPENQDRGLWASRDPIPGPSANPQGDEGGVKRVVWALCSAHFGKWSVQSGD
ncbi:hypothetical protein CgunFtcFv8_008577 [Champsocephalus gunnari]|uniref:Uncharacterized protein n=1 Tax=Champsocephalus gunnari TaxID=52237 RepID=A0AAN8D5U6_CHAGU|nr:hypothetical protein CgunFtcFv8_008577 [Champsocephalus gunnari]